MTDASLGQSLMLLNSADVQAKLAAGGCRPEKLAADPRPDADKSTELFWIAFGRAPSSAETAHAPSSTWQSMQTQKRQAYEDIIWALINTKEFQFID